jgi:hypothetical protein
MRYDDGINFPLTTEGKRSTTALGRQVLAAALEGVDPEAAMAAGTERGWRKHYPQHFRSLEEASLKSSEAAVGIAASGLDALYSNMVFVRGRETLPIPQVMSEGGVTRFHRVDIPGEGQSPPGELEVPYQGELLVGEALVSQIGEWETRGIIEPTCGAALRLVMTHPEWLDLSDQTIVLLGAAAEMGPFRVLCRWRANIVAIDLDRPGVWERLIPIARGGNGRLTMPLPCSSPSARDDAALASRAGTNLITQAPEIAAWLEELEGPIVVGGYAYLDGGNHVRVALAMDAIMRQLTEKRGDVSLVLLPTPSDVFAVPSEAAEVAQLKYRHRTAEKLWQEPIRAITGHHFYSPNVTELVPLASGQQVGIVDSLLVQQGPNYALAKRLQRWRATVARGRGVRVSANVAPSTKTLSVVHNLALASAYAGAPHFGVEIFETETSNALMAALLVHDLRNEDAVANPKVFLDHPAELFMQGANHGGLWRAAFCPRSVMEIAALLGWRAAHHERKAS